MKKILTILAITAIVSCSKSSPSNSDSIVGRWKPVSETYHTTAEPNIEKNILPLDSTIYEYKSDGTVVLTPLCSTCATNYVLDGILLKAYKNSTLIGADTVKTLNSTTLIIVHRYSAPGSSFADISTLTMKRL